jgi:cytochrome P450
MTNVDPKLWGPDAAEFKPERWLRPDQGGTSAVNAANGGATTNYAFMTFLHGPRSCLGSAFAKSELACLVAAWVGRFSFELVDKSLLDESNVKVTPSVVAKPNGGLNMKVRVVDGW